MQKYAAMSLKTDEVDKTSLVMLASLTDGIAARRREKNNVFQKPENKPHSPQQ